MLAQQVKAARSKHAQKNKTLNPIEIPRSNLTFGAGGKDSSGVIRAGWGYYETIAGGSGAGPTWHGTSGVHTHITNTRIGDLEILERRYPVLLRRFEIKKGSGGRGEYNGGDGVVREFEFLHNLQVSMLSEVRRREIRYIGEVKLILCVSSDDPGSLMACTEERMLSPGGTCGSNN
jgi:N-methylhydantoinase B/oxoprolinase/acetone carboxylase alpha subunit